MNALVYPDKEKEELNKLLVQIQTLGDEKVRDSLVVVVNNLLKTINDAWYFNNPKKLDKAIDYINERIARYKIYIEEGKNKKGRNLTPDKVQEHIEILEILNMLLPKLTHIREDKPSKEKSAGKNEKKRNGQEAKKNQTNLTNMPPLEPIPVYEKEEEEKPKKVVLPPSKPKEFPPYWLVYNEEKGVIPLSEKKALNEARAKARANANSQEKIRSTMENVDGGAMSRKKKRKNRRSTKKRC